MNDSYTVYDDANRRMETFAGPCRLARWADLPDGWSIEWFRGTVSMGMVSLAWVKRHAAEITNAEDYRHDVIASLGAREGNSQCD